MSKILLHCHADEITHAQLYMAIHRLHFLQGYHTYGELAAGITSYTCCTLVVHIYPSDNCITICARFMSLQE